MPNTTKHRTESQIISLDSVVSEVARCRGWGLNVTGILMPEDAFYALMGQVPNFYDAIQKVGVYAFPLTDDMQLTLGTNLASRDYLIVSVKREMLLKMINSEINMLLEVR